MASSLNTNISGTSLSPFQEEPTFSNTQKSVEALKIILQVSLPIIFTILTYTISTALALSLLKNTFYQILISSLPTALVVLASTITSLSTELFFIIKNKKKIKNVDIDRLENKRRKIYRPENIEPPPIIDVPLLAIPNSTEEHMHPKSKKSHFIDKLNKLHSQSNIFEEKLINDISPTIRKQTILQLIKLHEQRSELSEEISEIETTSEDKFFWITYAESCTKAKIEYLKMLISLDEQKANFYLNDSEKLNFHKKISTAYSRESYLWLTAYSLMDENGDEIETRSLNIFFTSNKISTIMFEKALALNKAALFSRCSFEKEELFLSSAKNFRRARKMAENEGNIFYNEDSISFTIDCFINEAKMLLNAAYISNYPKDRPKLYLSAYRTFFKSIFLCEYVNKFNRFESIENTIQDDVQNLEKNLQTCQEELIKEGCLFKMLKTMIKRATHYKELAVNEDIEQHVDNKKLFFLQKALEITSNAIDLYKRYLNDINDSEFLELKEKLNQLQEECLEEITHIKEEEEEGEST